MRLKLFSIGCVVCTLLVLQKADTQLLDLVLAPCVKQTVLAYCCSVLRTKRNRLWWPGGVVTILREVFYLKVLTSLLFSPLSSCCLIIRITIIAFFGLLGAIVCTIVVIRVTTAGPATAL